MFQFFKILSLGLCMSGALSAFAERITIDRMLLKVNETAYTQRQLEVYLLVKSLRADTEPWIVSQNNWNKTLKVLKQDMLSCEETYKHRTATFAKITNEDVQSIQKLIASRPETQELSQRLAISSKDVEQSLAMLARVQRQNREQLEQKDFQGIPQQRRVASIEKRNSFRFYDGTEAYRHLQADKFTVANQ